MHQFTYKNGSLHCEGVDIQTIAEIHGSPTYIYSSQTILNNYNALDSALGELDHAVEYAVKANSNLAVIKLLVEAGSGFDIVSVGELKRVIAAGGEVRFYIADNDGKWLRRSTVDTLAHCIEGGKRCRIITAMNVSAIDKIEVLLG